MTSDFSVQGSAIIRAYRNVLRISKYTKRTKFASHAARARSVCGISSWSLSEIVKIHLHTPSGSVTGSTRYGEKIESYAGP